MKLSKLEEKMIRDYRKKNRAQWARLIREGCYHANRDGTTQGLARRIRKQIAEMRALVSEGADYGLHNNKFGWFE